MATDKRIMICLQCKTCKNKNYYFGRYKKKDYKLDLSKFCKACGKSTEHKEIKA